jgi:dCTP diphosphatase
MIRRNVPPTLLGLKNRLREFARARDWEQFHTPKNLAVSIAIEAAELLEIFQWLSDAQASQIIRSKENMGLIRDEMADIFVYLIRLADILGIDLIKAAMRKIVRNSKKYPVATAKGNALKYSRRRAR